MKPLRSIPYLTNRRLRIYSQPAPSHAGRPTSILPRRLLEPRRSHGAAPRASDTPPRGHYRRPGHGVRTSAAPLCHYPTSPRRHLRELARSRRCDSSSPRLHLTPYPPRPPPCIARRSGARALRYPCSPSGASCPLPTRSIPACRLMSRAPTATPPSSLCPLFPPRPSSSTPPLPHQLPIRPRQVTVLASRLATASRGHRFTPGPALCRSPLRPST